MKLEEDLFSPWIIFLVCSNLKFFLFLFLVVVYKLILGNTWRKFKSYMKSCDQNQYFICHSHCWGCHWIFTARINILKFKLWFGKTFRHIVNSCWISRQVPNLQDILRLHNCSKLSTGLNVLLNKPLPLKSNHGNNSGTLASATVIYCIMTGKLSEE